MDVKQMIDALKPLRNPKLHYSDDGTVLVTLGMEEVDKLQRLACVSLLADLLNDKRALASAPALAKAVELVLSLDDNQSGNTSDTIVLTSKTRAQLERALAGFTA